VAVFAGDGDVGKLLLAPQEIRTGWNRRGEGSETQGASSQRLERPWHKRYPSVVQWAYKATEAKVDIVDTGRVLHMGFICRSSVTSSGARPANVHSVEVGDLIHVFYVRPGKEPHPFGCYEVLTPEQHAEPALFHEKVGTALFTARPGGRLAGLLASLPGYKPDPRVGLYPGWIVRKISGASKDALRSFTPGSRSTLVRVE
jgi:hypothetical protein